MSLDNAIYALSNFNAIMGSINGYTNDKRNGLSTGDALSNMGNNMIFGALRNEASREIQQNTGSYIGYALNNIAGYGNAEANYKGTIGTIGAAMLSSPYGMFGYNPFMTSSLYGCGPFRGGYWNSGYFGGGCCHSFGLGGPSMFGMRGFLC